MKHNYVPEMAFWKEYAANSRGIASFLESPRSAGSLFVTDLDGTLLTDSKNVRDEELLCLGRLRNEGCRVAIATGRSLYSFQRLVENDRELYEGLRKCIDYLIFSTGAGILDISSGDLLSAHSLTVDDVDIITRRLEKLDVDYMIHAPIPDTSRFYYRSFNGGGEDFRRRIGMYSDFGEPLVKPTRDHIERFGGATEVLCIEDSVRGPGLARHIADILRGYSVIKATSPLDHQSVWIEIFNRKSSKSAAVKWLADLLKVPRTCVCAVGNDYNDEDMLCWAGHGYIVENGPLDLMDKYIPVASNNSGGVSEAVTVWLGKNP